MDRELWKKTFVTVAAMLGAWLVVVGGLAVVAVLIASHAVAPASDHEAAPAANAETQPPASPAGASPRARNVPAPAKGREAI